MSHQNPAHVLDGADMNQDIHQLIGYVFTLGCKFTSSGDVPTSHLSELATAFLEKHRPSEVDEFEEKAYELENTKAQDTEDRTRSAGNEA